MASLKQSALYGQAPSLPHSLPCSESSDVEIAWPPGLCFYVIISLHAHYREAFVFAVISSLAPRRNIINANSFRPNPQPLFVETPCDSDIDDDNVSSRSSFLGWQPLDEFRQCCFSPHLCIIRRRISSWTGQLSVQRFLQTAGEQQFRDRTTDLWAACDIFRLRCGE